MEDKKKVPRLRFPGFTDDWKQRKLGDLMDIGSVKRVHQSDWRDSGVRFLRARDVVADFNNEEPDDYLYIDQKMYEEYSAQSGKVQQGDLLVTGVGTIGIPMLIKSEKPLYFKDGNIIWFKNKNAIDGQFFYYSFISKGIQDFIKESAGIGTVGTYTIDSGKKTPINLPTSIEEQQEIGIYFKTLDNLITLHQRQLDNLKNLKKGCLQKMFPRYGETKPELRFPGFTDDWEQRKVSEITKFHKQGFYTTEDYNESKKYYLLRGTDLTENKLILKDTPKIDATEKDYQAFKTEVGDFLIVRSGTVGTYGIVYEDIPAIFGSYLIDFRFDMEQVTNEFFGYFYQSESFKTQLRQIVQQSANTNINAENIKSTSIMLPSIDEQKRIGEYLGQIDNLITLHQRELDELNQFKKGMLQQMFV